MTQEKIVLLGQSAAELIELFRSESALGSQIREYFTSYCDCDIVEWLIAQLTAHNQEVVDRVNELLAAYDPYPVRREALHPKNGQLVKAYCQNTDLMGYYAINTSNTKSYELKKIQTDSPECQAYEVLDNFKSPDGKARGKHFYQSDIGTLIQRQYWLDADASQRLDYDIQYGYLDPDSPRYDNSINQTFSSSLQGITANGGLLSGKFQEWVHPWDDDEWDRLDSPGENNFAYSYKLKKNLPSYDTGATVFFAATNDGRVALFDYDATMAVGTNRSQFSIIAAVHRYNFHVAGNNLSIPQDGYWTRVWVDNRCFPNYDRYDPTRTGLEDHNYPFQPYEDRCIIGVRGMKLKNQTPVQVDDVAGEYRFDVTQKLNQFIAQAPAGSFLSKLDEVGRPIPKFFTKPKYAENGQLLGYEFVLRVLVEETSLKIYFQSFLLLELEREIPLDDIEDWHPSVSSLATNSLVTNFFFKTL